MTSAAPTPSSTRLAGPDEQHTRGGTFDALREPGYRILWIGTLFSFLAVQMQIIARGWLAFSLTGNNKGLGAVFLGFGLPMLLFTPWGGVAADRLAKRNVLMAAQFALAFSSAAIAAAILLDVIAYWMLIVSAVIQGAGFSFLGPVRMAFTAELAGRSRMANAIVLQQLSMNGTRIIGPSIAGALIGVAALGVAGAYVATAVLMVAAMAMTYRLPAGRPAADRRKQSPLAEMRDGFAYVRSRPLILLLVVTSFAVIMTAFPYVAFLPTLAERVFKVGASGYGAMSAVSGIGALIASLVIAGSATGRRAWRSQTFAGVAFGAGVALLAFAPSYAVGLGVLFLVGGASSVFQALNNSLVLAISESEYHGRVQSLLMLSFSGFGMMALPLGAIADAIGIRATMSAMGACAAVAVLVYAVVRGVVVRRGATEAELGLTVPPIPAEPAEEIA